MTYARLQTFRKAALVSVLGTSLLLTSCVSTPIDPSTMTPAEITLRQQQNEDLRIVQGVATGAALGAATGALFAALSSRGDSRAIARGAIVGGLVGGVAGGVDANNVNQGARAQASQQAQYREVIASANKVIASYRKSNAAVAQLIASENSRISRLNGELHSGRIDAAGYRRQLGDAKGRVELVDQRISRTERDLDALRSARSDGAPVSAQITALQVEKTRLQQQRNALRSAYSRVPAAVGLGV